MEKSNVKFIGFYINSLGNKLVMFFFLKDLCINGVFIRKGFNPWINTGLKPYLVWGFITLMVIIFVLSYLI